MSTPFRSLSQPSPLDYGRLGRSSHLDPPIPSPARRRRRPCLLVALPLLIGSLLVIAAACGALAVGRSSSSDRAGPRRAPTAAMRKACGLTRYPDLCVASLVDFPGATAAGDPRQLAHISMNVTLRHFGRALSASTEIENWQMGSMARSAYEDCLELLADSVDLLGRSLVSVSPAVEEESVGNGGIQGGSKEDVITWLSGAMTNQDTCIEGLNNVRGAVKYEMGQRLKDLSELVSNCLAIYAATSGHADDFSGTPIQNRRRRLLESEPEPEPEPKSDSEFPGWMSRAERQLLGTPTQSIHADIIVAQDGSGTVRTISEAIKKAPELSPRRILILIKAGIYAENYLKVGRKKTNLWFLGEGVGRTVITGNKSVGHDNITTTSIWVALITESLSLPFNHQPPNHQLTLSINGAAATGAGFVVRGITFLNEAGPGNHQAVALRIGADRAVIYQCEVKGYQDTLYVHSQRQFYRECDIYGTVDFIFGNAAVVFQNCTMWARKPMPFQKITVTAQNRKDPNQNTGMSIHASLTRPTSDLEAAKYVYPTYLGRPWKPFSRVVYMESYIGDHVDPIGWLEWNATTPTDQLYYGEYGNFGPRADTSQRVKWPGLHVNMTRFEAEKFTVAGFIFGQSWITSTGVAYQAGLSGW
ncbi:hypothetical protein Cgig2_028374 [Carnegiea gigantea]|uniref:Pectinesterase n=1 Tax=Carnegiea gigantea TaxID=171969 RepID=A0A9Q1K1S0_9CARY|nr:hypothetical protein Cgig2_028374 [Carnegiea gigantea]